MSKHIKYASAHVSSFFLQAPKDLYNVCYVPRPFRVKSRIRDLRTIIGKTQREFAFSIGISPIALNRIENDRLALSRRVAYKIEVEAGIDPDALLRGKLRTIGGQEYTAAFYKWWKENDWQDENVAAAIASQLAPLLVAAAVESKKRMRLVIGEILETLARCRTNFNLERPIDQFLGKQRPPMKWDDLLKPWERKEATAPRKPQSSSRRRPKA
jgi:transcriptional regulator with XRE-family HTH domain